MTLQAWFGHSYKGFGSGLRNVRALRLERLCVYAIASSGVSNSKAFVLSSSDAKKSSLPHCVHTTLIANLSSISSLLNTHHTIKGMKWASETKRKDPAFVGASCQPLLVSGPSPHGNLGFRTITLDTTILRLFRAFVKRLGAGEETRTPTISRVTSDCKSGASSTCATPAQFLAIRNHETEDILIMPIVESEDKPGILYWYEQGGKST